MPLAFARSILAGGAAEPSYIITSNKVSVNEGDSVTFTLTTENVDVGSTFPYEILGVSSADLSGASLTGNFVVEADGTDTLTFNVAADALTEGQEIAALRFWAGYLPDVTVTVNDTSLTPTYSLSRSATAINEGQSVTFTLTTTGLADGTTVPYTLSGISSSDIGGASLNGNFVVNNAGTATVTFTATADSTSEGSGETLTITSGGQSTTCLINDTSRTISYQWYTTPSATPNEGDTINFVARVYNSSETMWWHQNLPLTDVNPYQGQLTKAGPFTSGNDFYYTHTGSTTIQADATTEGPETFLLYLRSGSQYGTIRATHVMTIQDTSQDPAPHMGTSQSVPTAYNKNNNLHLSVGSKQSYYDSNPNDGVSDTRPRYIDMVIPNNLTGTGSYWYNCPTGEPSGGGFDYTALGTDYGYLTTNCYSYNQQNGSGYDAFFIHSSVVYGSLARNWNSGTWNTLTSISYTGSYLNGSFFADKFYFMTNNTDGIWRAYTYNLFSGVTTNTWSIHMNNDTNETLIVDGRSLCTVFNYKDNLWYTHIRGDGATDTAATYIFCFDNSGNYLGKTYVGSSVIGGFYGNASNNGSNSSTTGYMYWLKRGINNSIYLAE